MKNQAVIIDRSVEFVHVGLISEPSEMKKNCAVNSIQVYYSPMVDTLLAPDIGEVMGGI
jgi:hypothetical protein